MFDWSSGDRQSQQRSATAHIAVADAHAPESKSGTATTEPTSATATAQATPGSATAAPSVDEIRRWLVRLGGTSPARDDAGRIDRIATLERLKGAIAAAQARESVEFRRSQLAAQRAAAVPKGQLGRGIACQIGLARKESPHRAARMLTMATTLVEEMPQTLAALTRGEVSEWRAGIVTTETMTLDEEQRRRSMPSWPGSSVRYPTGKRMPRRAGWPTPPTRPRSSTGPAGRKPIDRSQFAPLPTR